ncbi:MAG TPA: sigma 54-interacting transcriptional regulator [Polyangiaceae bacterium]|nr:sigma 54-interacting transcriptional regulator [Polyangiaceae bacterium]
MWSDALQGTALAVAQERSVDAVLGRIVGGLAARPEVALARVWLVAPGDVCDACPMRAECPDRSRCLHLVASEGESRAGEGRWGEAGGDFRRFPLGVRKIGRIGASGEGLLVPDVATDRRWVVRPEWAEREGIESFAGQPLIFRGQVLGVLGVFCRARLSPVDFGWLRTFADHAAIAIAHSRAFDEIERLRERLERENESLKEELGAARPPGDIVGASPAFARALRQVELVAASDASVLVVGESGAGKELFARAVHAQSRRRDRPLVTVNCAAVPRELFESEFFGHVRGAFSGAVKDRPGRFQLADGGTLFLDEVGEIPLALQGKLLRVLQEGTFERVGDDAARRVDVRVVAATNRDLAAEAEAGRFRQDLYYRLSVFPIEVPPLRERREDVVPLARHFARLAARRLGRPPPPISAEQAARLEAYGWPGNVRELEHVVERAIIRGRGLAFELEPLAGPGRRAGARRAAPPEPDAILTDAELRALERRNLERALERAGGRVYGEGGAAALLGVKPTTLASRLAAFGLRTPRGGG